MAEPREPFKLDWPDFTLPPINLLKAPKQMKKILIEAQAIVRLTRVTWMPDDAADLFMESEEALKQNLDERDCTKIFEIASISAREIP
jgi:hypothetical protein